MTITAQIESFRETLEELKPHFPAHWEELGLYKDKMPLDPEYATYIAREGAGETLLATLRADGKVVGYFIGFVGPGLHYRQTLGCTMDIAYIAPEFRSGGNGATLFEAVKAELIRRGVKLWWVGSKNHKPIEAFYLAFGFTPGETYFSMWLGD